MKQSETDSNIKGKLFGNSSGAENIILAMNKMRIKDGKGDPLGFRVFLDESKLGRALFSDIRATGCMSYFD